jgi:hypothetical protein
VNLDRVQPEVKPGAGVKRPSGSLETPFSLVLLAAGEQIPGVNTTEMWFREHQIDGQLGQPAMQLGVLTTLPYSICVFLDQGCWREARSKDLAGPGGCRVWSAGVVCLCGKCTVCHFPECEKGSQKPGFLASDIGSDPIKMQTDVLRASPSRNPVSERSFRQALSAS